MVALTAHRLPGGPRELFLPDDIEVIQRIVTHPNVTSGRVSAPKTSDTYHDTGNPRTNAAAEMTWLANGRPGGEAGGYNGIIGTKVIYVTGPLNWETWHAGVRAGNLFSLGWEHAFGGDEDWQGSLDTACWLHAAIMECFDWPMSVFYWHQKWYGKWCPGQIFNRGLQSWVIAKITDLRAVIRAHREGTAVPPPAQEWADAILPVMANGKPWDGREDLVLNGSKYEAQRVTAKTTAALNQRQWAGTESLFTGPTLTAGTEVELLGWVAGELVNGISEWWIDTAGRRLWAGGIDAEPKQDPEYGQRPDAPPGVVYVNGRPYYPLHDEKTGQLGRTISVHRDGNLHKWADTASPQVGSVKAGEERVFRYWTRGESLPLTTKAGDEVEEGIWYAEQLHDGDRMWSGLSEERPD